ncbi:DUF86 domain-containing protein [Candidatus Woesearchaeota archaeon]|nr:DUF86 domain-containing protein [Candidatus Woesearchaeota archaeon]
MMELKDRILLKLSRMNTYLDELEELLPQDEEDFIHDLKTKRACQKTIEAVIEEVLDILSMLVSYFKLGLPESEDDIVRIAEKKGIISSELAAKVKSMKGFRNILVHKYGEIDDEETYIFLTHELKDFAAFEKEVKQYLKKK